MTLLFANLIRDCVSDSPKAQFYTHQFKIPLISCLYKSRPARSSLRDALGKIITLVRHDSSRSWDRTEWLWFGSVNWMNHGLKQGSWTAAKQRQVYTGEVEPLACSAQTHRSPRSSRRRKVRSLISLFTKPIPDRVDESELSKARKQKNRNGCETENIKKIYPQASPRCRSLEHQQRTTWI